MSDQLAAIDDALETGAADHHDPLTRELQELALALRADAPGGRPRLPAPAPGSSGGRLREAHRLAPPRPLWRGSATPAPSRRAWWSCRWC